MNGKIALGALGGIGLITTVSVASSRSGSSDPSWSKGIPPFSFLFSDNAFMDSTQDSRLSSFGYRYAGLLVSDDMESNDGWWKWSYKNLEKDLKSNGTSLSETFKDVNTSPQIPNSADSLKNWCRDVYEEDTHLHNSFGEPVPLFNNTSIWKYCSPIQQVPVSLAKSGDTYLQRTAGQTIGSALLALKGNDRIWHYRNKFFNGISADEFGEDPQRAVFREGRKNGRKIKDICADVYKKDASEINSDFFTFCSIGQTP